ncbi:MAG: DUF59 domain-containing protein [Nitrospirae bacterium]|nr:DUF59 domain-containing protein [Nitrospirota bacterium]
MPSREEILESLKSVFDPEIPVNVVDLGLIYDVEVGGEAAADVHVKMTMTAANCPAAQMIPGMVQEVAQNVPGVRRVDVEVVWDPPWGPARISPEGRRILGIED